MKKMSHWLITVLFLCLVLACLTLLLIFLFTNINRQMVIPPTTPVPNGEAVDVQGQEDAIVRQLKDAPWQGLRFLPQDKEWRFYGWTGETRQIKFSVPFDLIKVYYLDKDGALTYTWVATGADIPGQGYQSVALEPVQTGQMVAVRLFGKHVSQWGVEWEECKSELCSLSNMVDTILVLDNKGTGVSNGFIRYGWQPPTYPFYGFLIWPIEPAFEFTEQVSANQ
jgi:hypothetical protein